METYKLDRDGIPTITKNAAAVLDYSFDWGAWLAPLADTIASFVIDAPGLTVNATARNGAICSAVLAGGRAGKLHPVTCTIVTQSGRTERRRIHLRVVAAR